jgi:hypothetical protein
VGRKSRPLTRNVSRIAIGALLFAVCVTNISRLNAQSAEELACSNHVSRALLQLDGLLKANPESILAYHPALSRLKEARGCSPEGILAIAQASPFFERIEEKPREYVVLMGNAHAQITFAVRKATGWIQVPAALWRTKIL